MDVIRGELAADVGLDFVGIGRVEVERDDVEGRVEEELVD